MSHKRIVLVGGCFDLLHWGHLTFLKKAKTKGEILVVALESDDFIRLKKKRQPVHTQDQRAKILSSLTFVDRVIKLPLMKNNEDYFKLVKRVKPSVIAVSSRDTQLPNKKMQAKSVGAKLVVVSPVIPGFSTSRIISMLQSE